MEVGDRRRALIRRLPKVELHVHIEGCLDPAMALNMAKRNKVLDNLPFSTPEEAQKAFNFQNLQQFLDLRDAVLSVIIEEEDFYDLMITYLQQVAAQKVVHVEIHFDPQEGQSRYGISASLIACFMTELSPESALATMDQCLPWRDHIVAVGLARGIPNWAADRYPHTAFKAVMERARELGFRITAHAGEEGPPSELWDSIHVLRVERIDHGVQCLGDHDLVSYLEKTRLPLTVCPLSNFKLKIYGDQLMAKMRELLSKKLCLTVNSDDPPFFGGHTAENLEFWAQELGLTEERILALVSNSVEASFLNSEGKQRLHHLLSRTLVHKL